MAKNFKFMTQKYMEDMENIWNALWNGNMNHAADENDKNTIYYNLDKEDYADYFNANVFSGQANSQNKAMLQSGYGRWRPLKAGSFLADYFSSKHQNPEDLSDTEALTSWRNMPEGNKKQRNLKKAVWKLAIARAYSEGDYFMFFNSNDNQTSASSWQVMVNFSDQEGAMKAARHFNSITKPGHWTWGYRNKIQRGKICFGKHTMDPNPAKMERAKMVLWTKRSVNTARKLYDFCNSLNSQITGSSKLNITLNDSLPTFCVQFAKGIGCATESGDYHDFAEQNAARITSEIETRTAQTEYPTHETLSLDMYVKWKASKMAGLLGNSIFR